MTATDAAQAQQLPRLLFTFVGDWRQLRVTDAAQLRSDIERVVAHQFQPGDEQAPLRILARERFAQAAELARQGGAISMFVLNEISPGVPLPALMTIFAPQDLTIAPAVGTTPDAVMTAFKEARHLIGTNDEGWHEFSTGQALCARQVRAYSVDINESSDEPVDAPLLEVDYWVTVPGTKRLLRIAVQTPVVHAPHITTTYFDRTVAGLRYAA